MVRYWDPLPRGNNLRRSSVIDNVCAWSDGALDSLSVPVKVCAGPRRLPAFPTNSQSRIWKLIKLRKLDLNASTVRWRISLLKRICSDLIMYYENHISVASTFYSATTPDYAVVDSKWTQKQSHLSRLSLRFLLHQADPNTTKMAVLIVR